MRPQPPVRISEHVQHLWYTVDWLPDVVVELVRAFDVARTYPGRFGDRSAHSRHSRRLGDPRKTAPAPPQVLNEGRTGSNTQTAQQSAHSTFQLATAPPTESASCHFQADDAGSIPVVLSTRESPGQGANPDRESCNAAPRKRPSSQPVGIEHEEATHGPSPFLRQHPQAAQRPLSGALLAPRQASHPPDVATMEE